MSAVSHSLVVRVRTRNICATYHLPQQWCDELEAVALDTYRRTGNWLRALSDARMQAADIARAIANFAQGMT